MVKTRYSLPEDDGYEGSGSFGEGAIDVESELLQYDADEEDDEAEPGIAAPVSQDGALPKRPASRSSPSTQGPGKRPRAGAAGRKRKAK